MTNEFTGETAVVMFGAEIDQRMPGVARPASACGRQLQLARQTAVVSSFSSCLIMTLTCFLVSVTCFLSCMRALPMADPTKDGAAALRGASQCSMRVSIPGSK